MADAEVIFDVRGLVACVVQDWQSGEVLTLAYMNEEALGLTRETGELHLYSRSRGELWRKGATSGNFQSVRALRSDCDGDTLLALVEAAGPTCHTGERTCFHRGDMAPALHETLPALERALPERARERPPGSDALSVLENPRRRIGESVVERAEALVRAAREHSNARVDEAAAGLLDQLLMLLHSRGRALADAQRVLASRAAHRPRP
jgi:phosphoribosyl-AMP cyclohydrolase / phosphoribosyl-ATP pyrophosphohydrolase